MSRLVWVLDFRILHLSRYAPSSSRDFLCNHSLPVLLLEVDGQSYLTADFTLLCNLDDADRSHYLGLVVALLVVVVIGVPGFFLFLLMKHHANLSEPDVTVWLGFLYEGIRVHASASTQTSALVVLSRLHSFGLVFRAGNNNRNF
jgi:hypothetical protein